MKNIEFNNMSEEEQAFEYFYNNYCKKEGMPDFSEEAFRQYIENNKKERFIRRRVRESYFYPFTPEEAFKKV